MLITLSVNKDESIKDILGDTDAPAADEAQKMPTSEEAPSVEEAIEDTESGATGNVAEPQEPAGIKEETETAAESRTEEIGQDDPVVELNGIPDPCPQSPDKDPSNQMSADVAQATNTTTSEEQNGSQETKVTDKNPTNLQEESTSQTQEDGEGPTENGDKIADTKKEQKERPKSGVCRVL